VVNTKVLSELRYNAAESAFQKENLEVEAVNGWETKGKLWKRTVFLSNPVGGPTLKTTYTVVFQVQSDEIEYVRLET